MNLAELIRERIHTLFVGLAADLGNGFIEIEMTPDEWAGVPMALFTAEQALLASWKYLTDDLTDERSQA